MKKNKQKKLEFYLTLDRTGSLKVRKQSYALEDGELQVKLVMNVPLSFFHVMQIKTVAEITVPEQDLPVPKVSVS